MSARSKQVLDPLRSLGSLLKEAFDACWAHNISRMAASIAYFGAFSLAPIIVVMVSIASLVFGKRAAEGLIVDQLTETFGEETARFIQSMLAAIYNSAGLTVATVLAILLLAWAATRIIGSVRGALNDIWGVKGHGGQGFVGFLIGKAIDLGMVIGIGFMFLASMLANAAVSALIKYFSEFLPMPGWLLQVLGILFSLAVTTTFLIVMFRVLPNIKVRFLYILVGASVTAILFTIGNYVIGRYLGRTSPGSAFGAAGSLAVIMIWMYYVSYIIIFGAEVTRAYAYRVSAKRLRAAAVAAAGSGAPQLEAEPATTAETLRDGQRPRADKTLADG
jgi:membrane protein